MCNRILTLFCLIILISFNGYTLADSQPQLQPLSPTNNGIVPIIFEKSRIEELGKIVSGTGLYEVNQVGNYDYGYKIDRWNRNTDGTYPESGNLITIATIEYDGRDVVKFNWSSTAPLNVVVVKASTWYCVYFYDDGSFGDEGLYAPDNKGIGHVSFGWGTPEINVQDSSFNDIYCNTGTYDFGTYTVGESNIEETFTIQNIGTSNLDLIGSPYIIEILGSDAGMFKVVQTSTTTPIAPGFSTTFSIIFNPTSEGEKIATISISNNDSNENPYQFNLVAKTNYTSGSAIGWIGGGSDGWKTGNAPQRGSDYRSFYGAMSVCLDNDGNILVVDVANYRVSKWDKLGNAIGWFGGGSNGWKVENAPVIHGTDYQSFYVPLDIAVDNLNNIYIAEQTNKRISKWNSSGEALGWIGGGSDGWKIDNAPSYGKDYQSFNSPWGVCIDSNQCIYVADVNNKRICKWNNDGTAIGWIGGGSNGWKTSDVSYSYSSDYRSIGFPSSVFVDSEGFIYIAEFHHHRVSKWDKNGNAIGWIGGGSNGWKTSDAPSAGADYRSFNKPTNVFVNSKGEIYVADVGNHRISKWNKDGNAIGWIGGGYQGWQTGSDSTYGSDDQSFLAPWDVYVDSTGFIYVADSINNRICKWYD